MGRERGREVERDECGRNSKGEPVVGRKGTKDRLCFFISLREDIGQALQQSLLQL